MTTVALIRQNFLNTYLRRDEGSTSPWNDVQAGQAVSDAIGALWEDGCGARANGTVATSQASDVYTIPAALAGGRVSRIELELVSAGVSRRVDRVTHWSYFSQTQVRITPMIATMSGLSLRFFGWIPFLVDGSTLPVTLEKIVALKAAALAYGQELGQLANSQLQQGLDQGRVVDYPTAVGLSAYWERRYRDALDGSEYMRSFAPRAAHAR